MPGNNEGKLDAREHQRIHLINHKCSEHKRLPLSVS